MAEMPFNLHTFDQFLKEEKLVGATRGVCGKLLIPPRPLCSGCGSQKMEWTPLSGKGKLRTFTAISIVPPAMAAKGFGRKNPYCSGVVELEEGSLLTCRIAGVKAQEPEGIEVGAEVRVRYLHEAAGDREETVLAFEPVCKP
jgi:scaffold protein (connect acetoacetyl-CoA thiolase and HMG-CoA synthase)